MVLRLPLVAIAAATHVLYRLDSASAGLIAVVIGVAALKLLIDATRELRQRVQLNLQRTRPAREPAAHPAPAGRSDSGLSRR